MFEYEGVRTGGNYEIRSKTCINCHYEQIDRKKAHEEPCKTCFAEDKPGNRFPKYKEIRK